MRGAPVDADVFFGYPQQREVHMFAFIRAARGSQWWGKFVQSFRMVIGMTGGYGFVAYACWRQYLIARVAALDEGNNLAMAVIMSLIGFVMIAWTVVEMVLVWRKMRRDVNIALGTRSRIGRMPADVMTLIAGSAILGFLLGVSYFFLGLH